MLYFVQRSDYLSLLFYFRPVKKALLFFLSLLILACDNKLDLNASYKETPIVYGLLSMADSVQYIKVNKAYLGEGNAYYFADEEDSVYFKYPIIVQLEERNTSGTLLRMIVCDSVFLMKDSGIFSSIGNKLYRIPAGLRISPKNRYKLVVRKKADSTVIASSVTDVVDTVKFAPRAPASTSFYYQDKYTTVNVAFMSPDNAFLAEMLTVVYYKEYTKSTGDSVLKSFSFYANKDLKLNGEANNETTISFSGKAFYDAVVQYVRKDDQVYRKMDPYVRFRFSFAGKDLSNAINLSKPIISLNDIKPTFSNVMGGIGLFSSRYSKEIKVLVSSSTLDFLKNGNATKDLGFQ